MLQKQGAKAYFVGGCVRDKLLGISPNDFDIEVYGLALTTIKEIVSRKFKVDLVGQSFGILKVYDYNIDISLPRTEHNIGSKHTDFEVSLNPKLNEEEACRRRDFTINSILWDPITDQIHDPLNGQKDLEEKLLTPCSKKFSEDPLRVLRAMHFISRFNLRPSEVLVDYSKTLEINNIAKERIWEEWKKWLLKSSKPSYGLSFLKESGWLRFFPELLNLVDCPQDPKWHPEGDVWQHTLHCLDAFAKMRNHFHRSGDQIIFGLSVLCHDLGKANTTIVKENGRVSSRRHEQTGVPLTEKLLERIGVNNDIIQAVQQYVRWHMTPNIYFKDQAKDSAIRRLSTKVDNIEMLVKVAHADQSGRPPLNPYPDKAGDWLLKKATALSVKNKKLEPIILGRHLIELGMKPSPHFKPILDRAYEAQINGIFSNTETGKQWVEKQFESGSFDSTNNC